MAGVSSLPVEWTVHLEVDPRPRLDQPAGTLREDVALLSDRVLVEEHALLADLERAVRVVELTAAEIVIAGLDDRGPDVVNERRIPWSE